MRNIIEQWLIDQGVSEAVNHNIVLIFSLVTLIIVLFLSTWIVRRFIIPLVEKGLRKRSNIWNDTFLERNFFKRLSLLPAVVITYLAADLIFPEESVIAEFIKRLAIVGFILVNIRVLDAFFLAVQDIYSSRKIAENTPIRSYIQAIKIVIYIMAGIFIVAILTDESPWGILSILGGLTAILLLVFKDTLLGFIAGIQLSSSDMVRVGDWIEMPKYNADGDVIDVSIYTVKIRNWDKTISTIPTQALMTDTFRNWRGMSESGGRRIKRAVYIDMTSIVFCTDKMLDRFGKISLLHPYIDSRKKEIDDYNKIHHINTEKISNGRQQTNIGVFREYIIRYLKNNPEIHQNMTFLVRHLQPTPQGLPLEIYIFSKNQVWADYESIQADIFDHILAVMPEFGLRIFQYPTGSDLKGLTGKQPET